MYCSKQSMEEFHDLVNKVCNNNSSLEVRTSAERKLLELLSDINKWKIYATFLYHETTTNDTLCFFICIGLQRIIWKYWHAFTLDDQILLQNIILQSLVNRKNMQLFAKSKLEQVLATLCASSGSLEPATSLLVDANHPNAHTGLSAIRTVFDLILSDDPKLMPDQRANLITAATNILNPLTNLACSACTVALQTYDEYNSSLMNISLELLRLMVSKLPIGPHITNDVIALLFNIAELGAEIDSVFHRCALTSIEVLTELMNKRFIPPSRTQSDPSSNDPNHLNLKPIIKRDTSFDMLMEIMVNVISLLKKYRENGNIDDSLIVLSLLELITVFSENHLEKCMEQMMSTSSPQLPVMNGGGGGIGGGSMNQDNPHSNWHQKISLFFMELVAVTTLSMEPQVLFKIVSVWNRVIVLTSVRDTLITQPTILCPIASHLLQSSLVQTNSHLVTAIDELIDDFPTDALVDPHIKEVIHHLSAGNMNQTTSQKDETSKNNNSSQALGAEESSYIGTTLLIDIINLMVELVPCHEVERWLNETVSTLVHQNIQVLNSNPTASKRQASAVDLCFLIRILPMLNTNKNELLLQLIQLAVFLMESRMHAYGKELLVLELNGCQIIGQILQNSYTMTVAMDQGDALITFQSFMPTLLRGLQVVCDTSISPNPLSLMIAISTLLNQSVIRFSHLIEQTEEAKSALFDAINKLLLKSSNLPTEINALLICAQDQVDPHSIANSLVHQCAELCTTLDANIQSSMGNITLIDKSTIGALCRTCGAIDSLARNHSISKPQRRQCVITYLMPLQDMMAKLISILFQVVITAINNPVTVGTNGPLVSSISTNSGLSRDMNALRINNQNPSIQPQQMMALQQSACGNILYTCRIVTSMTSSLLQCLGKKNFGKVCGEVFEICVAFAERIREMSQLHATNHQNDLLPTESLLSQSKMILFEGVGLMLTKQFLELTKILAESTGSTSTVASSQAILTHRLLVVVSSGLGDDTVCAELLQPTLKAGIVAIGCYWQKNYNRSGISFTHSSSLSSNSSPIAGLNIAIPTATSDANTGMSIQPIALLLCQLCVASLGPNVPPQDTLTALEGLLLLSQQHQLFAVSWFQSECWGSLLTPCLRAIILRIHNLHRDAIESVLIALVKAGITSFVGSSCPSPAPLGSNPRLDSTTKFREFWFTIGREVCNIAGEFNCTEIANQIVYKVITLYTSPNSTMISAVNSSNVHSNNGLFNPHSPNLTLGSAVAIPQYHANHNRMLDMKIFIDEVLTPISAEIARIT